MQEQDEVTKVDQVERLMERPLLYNNVDGVGELGIGFMFVCYALLQWLQINSPANAIWHRMDVFLVWVGLMSLAIHYGTKGIKQHFTYPRTGFVEYPKRVTVWRPMVLGAGVSLLIVAGIALAARSHWGIWRSHGGMMTPVALAGLAIANSYAYGFARPVRWKWAVTGVIAVGSFVISLLPASVLRAATGSMSSFGPFSARSLGAWWLVITFYGAIFLISGGISFVLYLRHTQKAAETAE